MGKGEQMNEPLIDETDEKKYQQVSQQMYEQTNEPLCPECNEKLNFQGVCENCELDLKSKLVEKVAIAFAFVSTFGFFVKIVFF